MQTDRLAWTKDTASPLTELVRFSDATADTVIVGTGRFAAGQVMPATGFSVYPMREISFVLEGELETECDGRTVRVGPGELITIPAGRRQRTTFLKDTKLVYLFFGRDREMRAPD